MPHFDELRAIASRQHGLVSRRQARDAGYDRKALGRLVKGGYLSYLTPRVLRIGGSGMSPWESVMAGVLDVGYDAAASHLSAAALWGVAGIAAEPVHVVVTRILRRREPAAATIHHLTLIPDDQRAYLYDIPVTGPALTTLLVCASEGTIKGGQVLDHFLATRDLTVEEGWQFEQRVSKQGRNGLTRFRQLLESRDDGVPVPQSNNERRFEFITDRGGITTLRRQVDIYAPAWVGRVDYDDLVVPLIVEIHSERYHTSWAQRRADADRISKLEAAGYTVVVVWDYEIWTEPKVVVDRIREARARLLQAQSAAIQ
ncbi:MAG TPA: type IV toxin-antitoxin system AbiEi family antitoxin domain-containing protein [Acidimicrobiia bacterium]|nr:type IV toxin-antitoxin system AbiEi family antitoxin domain-containing protein [Acidimicrobiia bacterium]